MLHLDVVELEHIDVVGLEPLEALVDGVAHELALEALRELALPAARLRCLFVVDVVADLGRVDDVTSTSPKCFGELELAAAVAVCVGGVEEGDAVLIERAAHHRDRLLVGDFAPPAGGERPEPEANFAHANAGAGECAVSHVRSRAVSVAK